MTTSRKDKQDNKSRMREAYLDAVTVSARERLDRSIYLAPYDPEWPQAFARLAKRIRNALGDKVCLLEHVGSTSVPGLAAKPIIDLVLGVVDSADEASYVPPLEEEGFVLKIREPDWFQHRMLKTPDTDGNLHVFSRGCEEIDRMLAFRDWLRGHEDDRRRYEETKRKLAAKTWKNIQQYADAKTDVVQEIMRRVSGSGAS